MGLVMVEGFEIIDSLINFLLLITHCLCFINGFEHVGCMSMVNKLRVMDFPKLMR